MTLVLFLCSVSELLLSDVIELMESTKSVPLIDDMEHEVNAQRLLGL